jgi:hypothetical protein
MIASGAIADGDVVTVLAVPSSLVRGLPDGERAFLLGLVGEDLKVSETGDGIEVEAFDARSGIMHFLRMAESDVAGPIGITREAPEGS